MSALEPVILSNLMALSKVVADLSAKSGGVEVGAMVRIPSEDPVVTSGGKVFLRSGVAATSASYPGFPQDIPQSAIGAAWSQVSTVDAWQVSGIAYGNGVFVAVHSNVAKVKVSEDEGKTWTTYDIGATCSGVCFANGVFVAIRTGSNSSIFRSTDGKTWAARNIPGTNDQVGIAYGNGKFVIVSKSHAFAYTSADGLTWAQVALPQTGFLGVAFGNGVFVAIGGSKAAAYSPDGANWTFVSITTNGTWTTATVTFGNGVFIAASGNDSELAISPDGAAWSIVASPGSAAVKINFAKGRFYLSTAAAQWSSVSADKWVKNPLELPKSGGGVFIEVCASAKAVVAGFNRSVGYLYRSGDMIGAADYQQYLYLRVK